MAYAQKKGWDGENEAASFFDSLVHPNHHVCRIGGVEKAKHVYAGDVCLVGHCKKHGFRAGDLDSDSVLYPYFLEVKNQARPNVWSDLAKAEDDASLAGKAGAIGYFIRTPRNTKGERLVVMRPETLRRLMGK